MLLGDLGYFNYAIAAKIFAYPDWNKDHLYLQKEFFSIFLNFQMNEIINFQEKENTFHVKNGY